MDFLKDLSIDKVRNLAEDAINQAKPKTDVEARVYEVLSHKNWGSSSSLMHEVARDTFDAERFNIVTRLMWDGMENQRPAAWRVVFKALTLLEFLVKNGAERCVDDARNHGHVLRALLKFNYYEGTIDRGLGVREMSKKILDILTDDERIREERQGARQLREKFKGKQSTASSNRGGGGYEGYGNEDNWNSGSSSGGYGNGGLDSGKGYSGRYGGSSGGGSRATPTFAAVPAEKKKKKKKKKPVAEFAAPAAAPQPEVDLFSFDSPAPAPAAGGNDDFGDFQTTTTRATASGGGDEFDAFGTMRSATQSTQQPSDPFAAPPAAAPQQQQPDPFAAPPAAAAPPQQQQAGNFNAFPNNNMAMNNNAMAGNVGMATMNNAMAGMNLGGQQQGGMQPAMAAPMQAAADDDFGDFEDAAAAPPAAAVSMTASSDPMANLVSLDHLTKNPSKVQKNDSALHNFAGMGGVANQAPGQPAPSMNVTPLAAGGSDAISSMFAPVPPQPKPGMQQQGMQQQKQGMQQQGNMNPQMMAQMGGMQGNMMNPQMNQQQMMGQMGMNPQMMGQMGGMQGNMNPQMNQQMMGQMNPQMMQGGNMNQQQQMMGQMGMMNPQMMQGNMNPQMMGQMGGMQGNMNMNQQQWR